MNGRGGWWAVALGAAALSGGLALSSLRSASSEPAAPAPPVVVPAASPSLEELAAAGDVEQAPKGGAPAAELLLFLKAGTDPRAYAREQGLDYRFTLKSDPDAHVFAAADVDAARGQRGRSRADARVRRAYLNERLDRVKWAWTPNDPYYPDGSPAGFPGQWHLGNGAAAGVDIRVPAVWTRDITGSGVIVGIVDDGLQHAHPDLGPNYAAGASWDFGQNDADPSPVVNADRHGTSVAGVAAARGGNGIGGTGAAPLAGLAGLRIDFNSQTTAMFVDATLYQSSGAATTTGVKNHSYGYTVPYVESQAERDAASTSAAAGTIHLFAAGNERGSSGEDSNKQDVQSSPDVIAVAALAANGKYSSYSSFGANVFVTAPSSGTAGFGITTTDRLGNTGYNRQLSGGDGDSFPDVDYTSVFGGTSSAAPLAAGVIALARQAQPGLNVRFAKHLLARTCRKIDPDDATVTGGGNGTAPGSAWKTNAAGFSFNQNYGFGLIDADALTQQAVLYAGVTPDESEATGTIGVSAAIPDNTAAGVSRTFSLSSTTPLEAVLVALDVTHTFRGDLEAYLSSPSGTESRLAYRSGSDSADNLRWTFSTNAFWGENPAGTWTLRVRDAFATDVGTWNSFAVTALLGELVLNTTPPAVSSVIRSGSNPTNAASASFTVTFTKNVTGVDPTDFAVAAGGALGGASVSGVSGGGSVYTVTVNTGSGDGTLRLDVLDDDSIVDALGNPLAAPFLAGESYGVDKTAPSVLRVLSATPDGAYGAGAAINVTVDFSEAVTLSGGALQVGLSTGDVVSIAAFGPSTSAAGTYLVGAGDTSPDLDAAGPLVLSAGALRDAAGNDAILAVPPGQNLAALKALVIDTAAPFVERVRSTTPDGVYGPGAAINVTVDFSEAVTLSGGDLQVSLSTGDVVTIAPFGPASSAAGTYTVGPGDASSDLNSASPLALTGGTLRDAAANACVLSVPAGQRLADLHALVIDTAGPSVAVNQAAIQADPVNAGPLRFTAVFSEPVTGFGGSDVSFAGSTAGGALSASVTGSGTTYAVEVSGMTSTGTVVASIPAGAAVDAAGNGNAASTATDNSVFYDVTPPTVTVNQAGGQADPTNGSPVVFTAVFSEPVTGFAAGDVVLSGSAGTGTVTVSGGPSTYSIEVVPTSDGLIVATIPAGAALDVAGNGNAASTAADNQVSFDATSPAVTINQAAGQGDPVSAGPILFSVAFSEEVTGFGPAGVSFAGSTVGGTLVASVGGGGASYTVSVTGMAGNGTVVASVVAGAALDAVGNPSAASTSGDNTVTVNSGIPAVTINQAAGQADPANGPSIVFDVLFSEAVSGFATGDVSFAGSTAGGTLLGVVAGPSPGTAFTVTVSGMSSSGTVVASIPAGVAVGAGSGNPNAASTSVDNTVFHDVTPPTVTINQAAGQADPTNGAAVAFTVVFSEPVTGFGPEDVILGGGAGATTAGVAGSGATYTLSVSGMIGDGSVTASVAAGGAFDAAGNGNAASTSADNGVAYDATAPTVTINQAAGQADPTNGASIAFTVVFSEPVSGFATGDVSFAASTAGGALVGTVSGSGALYTVTVSGMSGDGAVVASIPAGMAVDAAGNPNAASTSSDNAVTRDATPPTLTIDRAAGQADPTNASPILFTAVFSEPVSGFVAADVLLGGATTATITGGPAIYTVSVTGMSGSGAVTASVPAGAAADAAGNGSAASASTDNSVLYDVDGPTVTVVQAAGQADPANGASIVFTVVFSEPVSGFAGEDVTLGGSAGATSAVVSGGPASYTVTVSGMAADGTVTAGLGAGVAVDAAGNGNQASSGGDNSVLYDGSAPTVSVEQSAGQADPTSGSPILFTAVFSEAVTGFGAEDVVVGGSAGGSASVSGGPAAYTISVSGMGGSGKVVVSIAEDAAVDAAGNGNEASTSADNAVTYDVDPPTVAGVSATTPDGVYGPGDSIVLTVAFSEPVNVAGTPQLSLETGAADAVASYAGGSGTSTLAFTYVVAAGHASADLDCASAGALAGTISDLSGNAAVLALPAPGAPGSLGAERNLVVDGTAPLAGSVSDGLSGPDLDAQLSRTTLSARWSGFSDPESGIAGYEWAIGTSPGGEQVRAFAPVGLGTSASTSAVDVLLALAPGTTYFVTVRASNGTGLTATASSDGITVNGSDGSPPAPPSGFVALPADQSILLEWTPSASADVVSYRIWWKEAAASWTGASLLDGVTGMSASILGLANGTAYDVMLKAVDAGENESAGVFAAAVPSPPFAVGGTAYGSIQAALDAAAPGETVNVGPGAFAGGLVVPPGVSLEGTSPRHTIIEGAIAVQGAYPGDPASAISNLTVTGGAVGVDGGTADVLLDHVIIHHATGHGATSAAGGRLRAVNCTILSNGGDGLRAEGIASARNNIVGKNGGTGIDAPAGTAADYNAVYGNALGSLAPGVAGTGNLGSAAIFVDEEGFDFLERSASPSVDAGDPADGFSREPAPNGGRINLGAFGDTPWAARTPASSGGGGGGGGGCGATGLELLLAFLAGRAFRRRRVIPI